MGRRRMINANNTLNATGGPRTWKKKPLAAAISAAVATTGGASAAEIETVIVTATKREESAPGRDDLRAGGDGRHGSGVGNRDVRRVRGVPAQRRQRRQRPRQARALYSWQRHRTVRCHHYRRPGLGAGRRTLRRRAAGLLRRTQPGRLRGGLGTDRGLVRPPGHPVRRQFPVRQPASHHPQTRAQQVRRRVQYEVRNHGGRRHQRRGGRLRQPAPVGRSRRPGWSSTATARAAGWTTFRPPSRRAAKSWTGTT